MEARLLVATPPLVDPNFDRTVVFLFRHGPDGAAGVILNRPTALEVRAALPGWEVVAASPAVIYEGGPVGDGTGIAIGVTDDGAVDIVDLNVDPTHATARSQRVRVFVGHAGWSPGQLEAEVEAGAWVVADAVPEDLVAAEPRRLWREVLRREGGRVARMANVPVDLREN